MPEISRFAGMIIRMFFNDIGRHNKPHVHVFFDDYNAVIGLDGELLAGNIPHKKMTIVQAWILLREDELYTAWNNAVRNMPFEKVKPIS